MYLPLSPCISPDQAEAAKREQWMAEKTKEIKDSTVRGLEPDIQRLSPPYLPCISLYLPNQVRGLEPDIQRLVAKQREEVRRESRGDAGRLGEI